MAIRTGLSAAVAYSKVVQLAAEVKNHLQRQRAEMVKPAVSANVVIATIHHLGQAAAMFVQFAAAPGLAEYARGQVADADYDIVAEYQATYAAIVNARDSLIALFPKQAGSGYLLYQQLGADGSITVRDFTAQQVAAAVALIDAVIATIE